MADESTGAPFPGNEFAAPRTIFILLGDKIGPKGFGADAVMEVILNRFESLP
jgi:hypothetical protein